MKHEDRVRAYTSYVASQAPEADPLALVLRRTRSRRRWAGLAAASVLGVGFAGIVLLADRPSRQSEPSVVATPGATDLLRVTTVPESTKPDSVGGESSPGASVRGGEPPLTTMGTSTVPATEKESDSPPPLDSHDNFGEHVVVAKEVFGDLRIGDSCDGLPDRGPGETADLLVLPAGQLVGGECIVLGWVYSSFPPEDAPLAIDTEIRGAVPGTYYDDAGNPLGYFDSPEIQGGGS